MSGFLGVVSDTFRKEMVAGEPYDLTVVRGLCKLSHSIVSQSFFFDTIEILFPTGASIGKL